MPKPAKRRHSRSRAGTDASRERDTAAAHSASASDSVASGSAAINSSSDSPAAARAGLRRSRCRVAIRIAEAAFPEKIELPRSRPFLAGFLGPDIAPDHIASIIPAARLCGKPGVTPHPRSSPPPRACTPPERQSPAVTRAAAAALRSMAPPSATATKGDEAMRTGRMFHRNAQTYLVHVFGRGLEADRYVIEKYRSDSDGQIHPVEPEQTRATGRRRRRRIVAGAAAVKKLRPERDEIIVCTALNLKGLGNPVLGGRPAAGFLATRYAR